MEREDVLGDDYVEIDILDRKNRLLKMTDSEVKYIWESIWSLERHDRPSDDWIQIVYSEMGRRGIPTN